jgi:catechol 2,3-dioxygenase-like lactoylglutathione lyase family enzyme
MRIFVRDFDSVLPWYIEKLGLKRFGTSSESSVTLRFKEDGNPVVLVRRDDQEASKTPMLFTKKIGKMRDVLLARGVKIGPVEKDRQGIHYFDIRDPEGNPIEVVEES